MTAVATEPVMAEDVDSSTEVETVGETVKKRGRRKLEDDHREEFAIPDDMVDEYEKIKVWRNDCGFRFGTEDDCNRPIKKDSFATEEVFIDYRIGSKEFKIGILQEEISDLRAQRDRTEGIENVVTREKAKKALKAATALSRLRKELAKDGLDVDELLKM